MDNPVDRSSSNPDSRPFYIAVTLALALAAVLCWLIWSAASAERAEADALRSESQTMNVLAANAAVLRAAQDAESGQRGYLLSGKQAFLEPYYRGVAAMPAAIDRLRRLTSGDALQKHNDSISRLWAKRKGQLERSIKMRRSEDFERLDTLAFLESGKQTMDNFRRAIAAIETAERQALSQKQTIAKLARERADRWRGVIIVFALLLFAICAAALINLSKNWRLAREHKLLEESNLKIEEGRRLFQAIIDSSTDAIFVKDRRGRFVFCNRKVEEVMGKTFDQLNGQDDVPDAEPEEKQRLEQSDRQVMATGERSVTEEKILVKGEPRLFLTEKIPWMRGNSVVGMIGIGRDITEHRTREAELEQRVAKRTAELSAALATLQQEMADREAAEQKMRQMQRIEALGHLTGGIAHDFNNMLAIVKGAIEMARRRLPEHPDGQLATALDNADEGATRAAELTARLLAFARQQPLEPKPVEVNRLLKRTAKLLARTLGKQIAIEVRPSPKSAWISVDEAQFENALVNLAVNARDAMPEGGKLALSSEKSGSKVIVAVADSGIGMSPEVKEHVFEPFFTTKDVGKGTGLGLSQVHGFVMQSGGSVEIDSTEGAGTVVKITIPEIDADTRVDEAPSKASSAPQPAGEMILLVEDEPLIRRAAEETLSSLGYRPIAAFNGKDALAKLAEHKEIVLMLTDIAMPEMDGRQLAHTARAEYPDLKVILTTGYNVDPSDDRSLPVLSKPYGSNELVAAIQTALAADNSLQGT